MSRIWIQAIDTLNKYWAVIIAALIFVSYCGGFVVQMNALQQEQTAIRLKIVQIEVRQTLADDKFNEQSVNVLTKLARIEAILEELRKNK